MNAFSKDSDAFNTSAVGSGAVETDAADSKVLPTEGGPLVMHTVFDEIADAAGNTTTAYTISVDDYVTGEISSTGDSDWVAVDLVAGQSYVFTVWGVGGSGSGLTDTELTLLNSAGAQLAYNDDAETGHNAFSIIEYTAAYTGTYYIAVDGYSSSTGDYQLSVADDVYSVDQTVDFLTSFGWGVPAPLHFNVAPGGTLTYNISGLTSQGQQLATWALEAWTNSTGLQFVATTSASADLMFDDNQSGAFAGPSSYNPANGIINQATINVGTGWLSSYGTTIDSYSMQTYIHEIGHALGLSHSGNYDGSASYAGGDYNYRNDSTQLTIMSYFSLTENTYISADFARIITPMIADVAAIDRVYGPVIAQTGDTVWGSGSNVGGYLEAVFDAWIDGASVSSSVYNGGYVALTINDTGGTDLLDLSPITVDQNIDLRPEGVSDIAGREGNLVIAQGTIIENVISGSGNDTITGNTGDNTITGGAGNDTINGGDGTDHVVIASTYAAATITDLGGSIQIVTADGTDIISGIEYVVFTDQTVAVSGLFAGSTVTGTAAADTLDGTSGNDTIEGLGGNDRLAGGDGNDTLRGGDGNDALLGQGGNDTIYGGDGNDEIAASSGDDVVYGGEGRDNIGGGLGDDEIYGEGGNDTIGAGRGNDTLDAGDGDDVTSAGWGDDISHGGAGNDTMAGSFGNDYVYGEDGNDSLGGGQGIDYLYAGNGDDQMGGGDDDDFLFGEAGNDFLGGGAGNDTMDGGTENDVLNGGSGNDAMTGGDGADLFVFNSFVSGEVDTITDFEVNVDDIRLRSVAGATAAEKFANLTITETFGTTSISYGGHTINLTGVSAASLDVDDFIFLG